MIFDVSRNDLISVERVLDNDDDVIVDGAVVAVKYGGGFIRGGLQGSELFS